MQPIMRRIDHFIIRVGEPNYQSLLETLTGTFGLYSPWPVTQHPVFKSGGVFVGNVDLELMSIQPHERPEARIFGIEFELCEWDTQRLKDRAIPHIAVPYIQEEPGQGRIRKWLNVFLPYLVGTNGWMHTYFVLARFIPAGVWERMGSGDNANNAAAMDFIFNKVYRQGGVLAVKYNPAWRDIDQERSESMRQHVARQGGPLGVVGVGEVVVGVKNLEKVAARWTQLLGPTPGGDLRRQIGDGPAIVLTDDEDDAIRYMTWQVRSPAAARAFLAAHGMLGDISATGIQIDPARLHGLDIRLVGQD